MLISMRLSGRYMPPFFNRFMNLLTLVFSQKNGDSVARAFNEQSSILAQERRFFALVFNVRGVEEVFVFINFHERRTYTVYYLQWTLFLVE